MDNGDKITLPQKDSVVDSRKAEVRLFLHDELLPLEKSKHVSSYNLVTEYAKTRKNKSFFIWILLGICFLVVAAITIFVMMYLSKQNEKIEVDSAVFSDLDMRRMLDTKSHAEMNYLVAENLSGQLENERAFKLKQAALDRDSGFLLLDSLRLQDVDEQRGRIKARYNKFVRAIHSEYDKKIETAAKESDFYKEKLNALNTVQLENADFASQVQQHERSLLVNSYEKTISQLQSDLKTYQRNNFSSQRAAVSQLADKYHAEVDALDPVLADDQADRILEKTDTMPIVLYDIPAYVSSLPQSVLTDNFLTGMKSVKKLFGDYWYIQKEIEGIPQKNSIAAYKEAEKRLVIRMETELGRAVHSQITSLNSIRLSLESAKANLEKQRLNLEEQNTGLKQQYDDLQSRYERLDQQYEGVSGNVTMFDAWFEQRAVEDKSDGYILDVAGAIPMKVFVVQRFRTLLFSTKEPVAVIVYHGKRRKVSMGTVVVQNGVYYFIPTDSDTVAKLKPGDRLVQAVE